MSDEEEPMVGSDMDNEDGGGGGEGGPCGKMATGCCCMMLGCILFPSVIFSLGMNEKNYVCAQKNTMDAKDNSVVVTDCSTAQAGFVAFNCHVTADSYQVHTALSFDPKMSSLSSIQFKGLSAYRKAEVYCCVERKTSKKVTENGKQVTKHVWKYKMDWTSSPPQSSFRYPTRARRGCTGFDSSDELALTKAIAKSGISIGNTVEVMSPNIKAGAYVMSKDYIQKFTAKTNVPLLAFKSTVSSASVGKLVIAQDTDANIWYAATNILKGVACKSDNPGYGCARISYYYNNFESVAAITESDAAGALSPHPTKSSWGCGAGNWSRVIPTDDTTLSKEKIMKDSASANDSEVWLYRIGGILFAWLAIYCVLYPIVTMADIFGDVLSYIPCCGGMLESIVEGMVTFVVCMMSCSFGCSCALFTIAVVWVVMRPMVGICLMVLCLCLCGASYFVAQQFHDPDKKKARDFPDE